MTAEHSDISEREQRLGEIAFAYLEARDKGQAPNERDLLSRHPDFAEELAEFLADQANVERLAAPLRPASLAGQAPPAANGAAGVPHALGDFRILREIGHGGMGVVYEAEQLSLGRRVALKTLPFAATMDPRQLHRFQNEARAAASLEHPHIVPIYGVGCERGVHYYAMKFIDGQTLAAMIDARRTDLADPPSNEPTTDNRSRAAANPTTPIARASTERTPRDTAFFRRVAEWGIQAAEALEHAHSVGIVHRDIKPANLMIDGQGKLWVTDFGLARTADDAGLTMTGDLVGTLRYMSPEQALAKHGLVDHRSDVYALGATLYELLTLRPAMAGKDRQEILHDIAVAEPQPPRALNPSTPKDLETVILKGMAKEPGERYATAKELADDLCRFVEDRPIVARRPSRLHRLRRWAWRRRRSIGLVVLAALVVLVGLGVAGADWTMRRAATHQAVIAALDESLAWQRKRRLPEALAAARHADELAATGSAGAALRERARIRREELELLDRLENVGRNPPGALGPATRGQGSNKLYTETFEDFGLDLFALSPEDAGARLRGTTVAVELAAVLDDWAWICLRGYVAQGQAAGRHLLQVARAADLDPWRTRMRDALEAPEPQILIDLAASPEAIAAPPSTLYVLARALISKGAPEQAETLLRNAQRRYPDDYWLNTYLFQFLSYSRLARPEEMLRFTTAAISLRPQDPHAHNHLGLALWTNWQLDEAIVCFQEALRIQPDFAPACASLGDVFLDKGQLDDAVAQYRKAISLTKGNGGAYHHLGTALAQQGRLDEAITSFKEAIQVLPHKPPIHYSLGLVLEQIDHLHEAIAEYRKALRFDPDLPGAHNAFAWLLATNPDTKFRYPVPTVPRVKKNAETVLKDGNNRNNSGASQQGAGKRNLAVEGLQSDELLASKQLPMNAFFLAMVHWQLGEKDKARDWYTKGLEWMCQHQAQAEELKRFRAEAEELLGIRGTQPAKDQPPNKQSGLSKQQSEERAARPPRPT
jgi:serine/threonine protein kinase/Flp pilus assembly protein TadD